MEAKWAQQALGQGKKQRVVQEQAAEEDKVAEETVAEVAEEMSVQG